METRTRPEVVPAPPLAADPPRLGLLALTTDLTVERDAARVIGPDEAALHVARVPFENPTTPETLRALGSRIGAAAALLAPGVPLAAVGFACTSGTVAIGEGAVARSAGEGRPGVPVVTPISAALLAFRALGARRIALIVPYLVETAEPMVERFEEAGMAVVRAACFGMADDRDMARIDPDALAVAAAEFDHPEADALFLSCTALPALVVAGRIEAATGKPVVTSNGALLWALRRLAGLKGGPAGMGRLMALPLPEGAP